MERKQTIFGKKIMNYCKNKVQLINATSNLYTNSKVVQHIKENGLTVNVMAMEFKFGLMERDMKVN